MLMRVQETVDYNHVPERHAAIHARLENWARYVSVRRIAWPMQPMFRNAKTPRGWDADPHIPVLVDSLDGHVIEKAVAALPPKRRTLIRWLYVFPWVPDTVVRRELAMTRQLSCEEINKARDMLRNIA